MTSLVPVSASLSRVIKNPDFKKFEKNSGFKQIENFLRHFAQLNPAKIQLGGYGHLNQKFTKSLNQTVITNTDMGNSSNLNVC